MPWRVLTVLYSLPTMLNPRLVVTFIAVGGTDTRVCSSVHLSDWNTETGLVYAVGWQFYKPQREGMVTLLGLFQLHSLYASGNWIVFHYSVV
jgi:hypothetical protein